MYPHDVPLLGLTISVWNFTFLLGVLAGYPVLRCALGHRQAGPVSVLPLRWLATVYLSALGAQLFAYLFDLNTSALPPASVNPLRYYLDPLYGPKTLYGAIVFLPVTMLVIAGRRLGYVTALDAWTPAMFVVLAVARAGCFLQGCCYGVPSRWLGVSFPPHGTIYHRQLAAGLIAPGSPTLPVVPTQAVEAAVLVALGAWTMRTLKQGRTTIFPHAVALYSALRFVLEIVRDDPDRNLLGPLSTSQWIATALLLVYGTWRLASSRTIVPAGASSSPR